MQKNVLSQEDIFKVQYHIKTNPGEFAGKTLEDMQLKLVKDLNIFAPVSRIRAAIKMFGIRSRVKKNKIDRVNCNKKRIDLLEQQVRTLALALKEIYEDLQMKERPEILEIVKGESK